MRAHEFMTPGILYIRALRRKRTLTHICQADDDWTQHLIEGYVRDCFHATSRGRYLECAEGPEFTTGSGDKGTITPATDEEILSMYRAWTKERNRLCDGWSIEVFLSEVSQRPDVTPAMVDRLTTLAQPFLLEVK